MKKLLTLLLVVAMVLGIVSSAVAATTPSTVAGAKFSDIAGNDAEADITLLAVKNIMKGDAGLTTVRPDSTITRAEFAAMIIRMLGKDTLAASLAQIKPTTKDEIPAWAWGYVNLATSMGIMKGYPDGTFLPNNNVTFAEAIAMLERAIGLDKKAVGVWPTNYLVVAYDYDLVDGVDVFADVPATRGDVAVMMVNTMYTPKFVGINQDTGADVTTAAILSGTAVVEGMVTSVAPDSNSITLAVVGSKTLATSVALAGAKSFSDLVNVNVQMVLVNSKVVFIAVTDTANVVTGTFDEVVAPTGSDTNTYVKLSNGNKYPVKGTDDAVTGKLNTTALTDWTGVSGALTHDDPIVLNLVDSKVVYVEINRVNIQNALAKLPTKVDSTNYTIVVTKSTGADTGALDITTSTPVTIDGVAKTVADLKANDVVYVSTVDALEAAGTDVLKISAYRATVKGTVTAIKAGSSTTVTLKLADGTSKDYVLSIITAPSIGDTVEYRLNSAGKARFVVTFSATVNVGYVTDKYTTTNADGTKYYVVIDQAGTAKTINVGTGTPDVLYAAVTVDTFIQFTTDAGGKLATAPARTPTGVDGTVVAVDAANGIVVVLDEGDVIRTFGVDGVSVYEENEDGTYTSVGLAGLAKDDAITFEAGEYDLIVIPQ